MIHDAVVHKITRRNPFLQDWPYYGVIDILNPVATAQYQHSVTIPTKPGMAHDFRDLRFFQADGTEIPFWNESKTDGSTSFNWFKPYSLSQRKAYVFYGNREAVSQSNGDKTFEFFDDFSSGSIDTTKWTVTGSGVAVSGGIATISASSSTENSIASISTFTTLCSMRARLKSAHFNSTSYYELFLLADTSTVYGQMAHYSHKTAGLQGVYSNYDGTHQTSAITGWTADTYAVHECTRTTNRTIWLVNDTNGVPINTHYSTTASKVWIYARENGASISVDWVLVRKHVDTEPTCQLNQSGLRNPAYR